jgi:hypothetical protein
MVIQKNLGTVSGEKHLGLGFGLLEMSIELLQQLRYAFLCEEDPNQSDLSMAEKDFFIWLTIVFESRSLEKIFEQSLQITDEEGQREGVKVKRRDGPIIRFIFEAEGRAMGEVLLEFTGIPLTQKIGMWVLLSFEDSFVF